MKKVYLYILLALLITLTTVGIRDHNSDDYQMASLADAGEASNAVLIHEVTDLSSKITKMNRQGHVIFEKQLESRAKKDFYMYSEFTVGADGRIYVLVRRGNSPLSVIEELVFVYDEEMNLQNKISIITYDLYREYAFSHLDCVDGSVYVLNRFTGEILDVDQKMAIGVIYDQPTDRPLVKDFVMHAKDLIYISSYRGEVWRYKDGVFQIISKSFKGASHFVPDYLGADQNGDLYLMNLYDMNLYEYKDETWYRKWEAEAPINDTYVYGDFSKIAVDENGQVAAINRRAEEVLFIDDGGAYVVEVKENYINTYGVFASLMFLGLSLVFIGFHVLVNRIILTKGRLPLAFKQSLFVSIILLVTIVAVGYLVVDDVIEIMKENRYAKLNAIAFEKVSSLDMEAYRNVKILEDYDSDLYGELRRQYLPYIAREDKAIVGADETLYFDTYILEDGYLFRGINYDMLGYEQLHGKYEGYYDVANGKGVYNDVIKDDNGTSWMISVIPIVEKGEIIGIFEVGSDYRKFLANTETVQGSFAKLALTILLISMVSIIVIINRLLNNLKKMTDAVEQISKGDLEVTVAINSSDEFGVFANGINRMVENVKKNMDKVYAVNAAYSRFIPKSIEQLLGKEDLMYIQEGEEVILTGYIVYIKYDNDMNEASYDRLNETFPDLLKKTYDKGGVVLDQTAQGIKFFFEDRNICFAMLDLYVDLLKTILDRPIILMDQAQVQYSLVGTSDMLTPMYYSDATLLFEGMVGYAETLNTRFLLSQRATESLDYDHTNIRPIGFFKMAGKAIKIYEYFEYQSIEEKKIKVTTRSAFEHGVLLYSKGDYQDAIDYFIKVIAVDNQDTVSKILLGQCQEKLPS